MPIVWRRSGRAIGSHSTGSDFIRGFIMDQKRSFQEVSRTELQSVEGGSFLGNLVDFLKKIIRTPPTVPIDPNPSRIPIRA